MRGVILAAGGRTPRFSRIFASKNPKIFRAESGHFLVQNVGPELRSKMVLTALPSTQNRILPKI